MREPNADPELRAAVARLAAAFSPCPSDPHGESHTWDYDEGQCIHCRARFPYAASTGNDHD